MSWANIARAAPAPAVAAPEDDYVPGKTRVAVVDANAIISGLRLEGLGDKFVTIKEVLDEIRDKQSRQFLSTLPYGIDVKEPTEESMKLGELIEELRDNYSIILILPTPSPALGSVFLDVMGFP